MPRVTPITTKEQVASAHQPIFDAVAEGRGSVRGPFSIMMYSPEMCNRVLNTSNFLRFQSSVKPKEGELAICATAREKDCKFVWAAHVTLARKAGTREEAIAVVRDRKDAGGLAPDERAIVTYVRQLLRTNRVEEAVFDALKDRYGVPWIVELTGIVGHYGMITGLLNAFEMLPAADAEQLPV
jgi:4-carboxymuconolactone decarboxylase